MSEQSQVLEEEPRSRLLGRLAGVDRWWLLVLAAIGLIFLLIRASPHPYEEIFRFLTDGIVMTLQITVAS
ncbi:MAG: hypothetical protein ACUVWB_09550, partial [Anaerolineae bacterium]